MIEALQSNQIAKSTNKNIRSNVVRNELGYYWTFQNSTHLWRQFTIDNDVVNSKWIIEDINKKD